MNNDNTQEDLSYISGNGCDEARKRSSINDQKKLSSSYNNIVSSFEVKTTDDKKEKENKVASHGITDFSYFNIFKEIIASAIPATFGLLFIFLIETVNIIIIGQYNDPTLIAAIGIGNLFVNLTGYVPAAGLLGGIDTICSQFYGQDNLEKVGLYSSIGRLIITSFFFCITVPLNFLSYKALTLMNIEHEIAINANHFCHAMSISVFFSVQFQASLRYLQSMNIYLPSSVITLITAVLHPVWAWLFIVHLDLGVVGAGLSVGVTQILNLIIVCCYIPYGNPHPESYFLICKESFVFKYVWEYLCKAVPAALLFSADWIGFEILTLLASFLGPIQMAANVCLFNYITVIIMIQVGLSMATTTLVGNSIGAGNKKLALMYAHCCLLLGLTIQVITVLITLYFRYEIPALYTHDVDVQELFIKLLAIYCIFAIPDSGSVILHGIIKGFGKQKWASISALTMLYPVNIPLAYTLCYYFDMKVLGLWTSQCIVIFSLNICYTLVYIYTDLDDVVKEIEDMNKNEEKKAIKQN